MQCRSFVSRKLQISALGASVCLTMLVSGCGALVHSSAPISATYTTHVSATVQAPSATATVYQASLLGSTPQWSTQPTCTFTPSGLEVKPSAGQAYICLAPPAAMKNVIASVDVQQVSGSPDHAYGLAFRHNQPKSYYFFGIDGHGRFTLAVVRNDVSTTVIPFMVSAAIHQGIQATNRLEVVAQGEQITLLVNGTVVAQATLSTYSSGTVGLRGVNDGTVRFTHLLLAHP